MKQATKTNRSTLNLAVDVGILLAFLVAMAPRFSGLAIHEWLSISFGAAIVAHLLLHWQWIVSVTQRFLKSTSWSARVNYVLNSLLFLAMTVCIFSGVMMSEVALPSLGIAVARGGVWHPLHSLSANLSVVIVGLHVALHWSWVVTNVRRIFTRGGRAGQVAARIPASQEA